MKIKRRGVKKVRKYLIVYGQYTFYGVTGDLDGGPGLYFMIDSPVMW